MALAQRIFDSLGRLKRRLSARSGPPSGVLLISSGGVGDTVLFSLIAPQFAALAEPGETVHIVMQKASGAVGFLFPAEIGQITLDYRRFIRNPLYRLRFLERIYGENYRIVVSTDHLRLPTVDDAIVEAAESAQSFALSPRSWPKHDTALQANRGLYTRWTEPSPGMAHRMVRWAELAADVTGTDAAMPVVRFAEDLLPPAETRARPYVVFHPFSSEATRTPGPAVWTALAEALADDFDIVLSVGPDDLARYPDFEPLTRMPAVDADRRGLRDKVALFRGARLMVTVDTSVMHLAVGSGANTLCLASAAHVVDSVPYDPRIAPDNVSFLYEEMPCQGCLGACIHALEAGRFPCVAALTADRVMAAVRARL